MRDFLDVHDDEDRINLQLVFFLYAIDKNESSELFFDFFVTEYILRKSASVWRLRKYKYIILIYPKFEQVHVIRNMSISTTFLIKSVLYIEIYSWI